MFSSGVRLIRSSRLAVRLIGTITALLFLIFSGVVLLLIEETRGDMRRQTEAQGRLVIRLLQGPPLLLPPDEVRLARSGRGSTRDRLARRLEDLRAVFSPGSAVAAIAVRDPAGGMLASASRPDLTRLPEMLAAPPATGGASGTRLLDSQEAFLVIRGDYFHQGEVLATLDVVLDLADLDRVVIATRNKTIRLVLIETLVVALLLFILVATRILRPLGALVQGTERIREGDLDHRVKVLTDDELGDLAASFNRMVERLKQARDEQEARACDLRNAYEQLQRTQDHLIASEKLSSVGRLAAGVAHEIGNPLSSILGYTEVLLMDEHDPTRRSYLERGRSEVERIERIVRALLDFSRPSGVEFQSVAVVDVLERTLDLAAHHKGFRQVTVHRRYPGESPRVRGSMDQLQQLFVNLCLNAAHAMEGTGNLWIRVLPVADSVRIEVEDEGRGIPREEARKVFDPFYTTKPPGEGTGLGLTICHTIVERHQGSIEVDSAVGKGTVFRVRLPRESDGVPATVGPERTEAESPQGPGDG